MILASTTSKIQLVTVQAVTVDVAVDWADYQAGVATPGHTNTQITTAFTTDISGSPASTVYRRVKEVTIRNKHASASVDVIVQHTDGSITAEMYKVTLAPGATLEYIEGVGWYVLTPGISYPLLTSAEMSDTQRVLQSTLPVSVPLTFVLITNTAYCVYLGRMTRDVPINFVEFHVSAAGSGAQTAEVGLFSSSNPPNKSAQTLTKIVATGTVDSLTTTGIKRNTTSFAQVVVAGTHLWAVIRTAMATTQPTLYAHAEDMSQGAILSAATPGALTAASTLTTALVAIATPTVAQVPILRASLD